MRGRRLFPDSALEVVGASEQTVLQVLARERESVQGLCSQRGRRRLLDGPLEQAACLGGVSSVEMRCCTTDSAVWGVAAQTDCQFKQLGSGGGRSSVCAQFQRSVKGLEGTRFTGGIGQREVTRP